MLTMFSTPKAFRGHVGLIQSNAIESWTRLSTDTDVILFGDEPGTADICARLGLTHVPNVATNEFGTPLLSDMFDQVRSRARHAIVCYSNADIIFMRDFYASLAKVREWRPEFLVVGRRCDLDLTKRISFDAETWDAELRDRAQSRGRLQEPSFIDYFAFSRSSIPRMPGFSVGRAGWDNWVVWNTRARNIPVVDVTSCVLAVHQNHDYRHHAGGRKGVWHGPEAARNADLIRTWARMFTIADSNYRLEHVGVRRNLSREYFARRSEIARRRLIDWTRPFRRRTGLRALNRTRLADSGQAAATASGTVDSSSGRDS